MRVTIHAQDSWNKPVLNKNQKIVNSQMKVEDNLTNHTVD
jgi:hypothetical protein